MEIPRGYYKNVTQPFEQCKFLSLLITSTSKRIIHTAFLLNVPEQEVAGCSDSCGEVISLSVSLVVIGGGSVMKASSFVESKSVGMWTPSPLTITSCLESADPVTDIVAPTPVCSVGFRDFPVSVWLNLRFLANITWLT